MELLSFVFAAIAVYLFLARRDTNLGLSALTVAWVIQLVLNWIRLDVAIR